VSSEAFGSAAAVVPKKTKTPYVFVVAYDTDEGIKLGEFPTRPEAAKFVNEVGAVSVVRVYKVSEVIQLKTSIRL
jgi:hypothetical protein